MGNDKTKETMGGIIMKETIIRIIAFALGIAGALMISLYVEGDLKALIAAGLLWIGGILLGSTITKEEN